MDRNSYIVQIPVMDTYWTMKLSKEGNSINTNGAVIGFISVLVLFLMGVLIYVQMGLFKKDENIQHLANLHKELERLKESYTLALDSANDALWEWNLITEEI
ncbi:hypothetical protein HP393_20050, partial [Clostridioides difficile]|nr:hypothetical protein [Clostridioides difficile]